MREHLWKIIMGALVGALVSGFGTYFAFSLSINTLEKTVVPRQDIEKMIDDRAPNKEQWGKMTANVETMLKQQSEMRSDLKQWKEAQDRRLEGIRDEIDDHEH